MVHTHTHTHTHAHTHAHTRTHTHGTQTDTTRTHTHTIRTQRGRHIYPHTHTGTDTHTHRGRHIHAHTHTQAISPQFLTLDHHFVRKGCAQTCEITILLARLDIKTYESERSAANAMLSCKKYHCTPVFDDRTSFRAKGLRRTRENRSFTSDFGDRTSFPAKGLSRHTQKRNFTSVFAIELRFVRKLKGLSRHTQNRNFTSVFGDRSSFRANGLRFVPSRWHCGHLQSIIAPARDKSKALFTSIRSSRKRAVDACHATTPKAPPGPQAAKLSRIIQETSTSCICRGMQELHNARRLPEICMSTLLRTALPRRFPPENGKPKIRAHMRTLI